MRAVIGMLARLAVRGVVLRIATAGMSFRISARAGVAEPCDYTSYIDVIK